MNRLKTIKLTIVVDDETWPVPTAGTPLEHMLELLNECDWENNVRAAARSALPADMFRKARIVFED